MLSIHCVLFVCTTVARTYFPLQSSNCREKAQRDHMPIQQRKSNLDLPFEGLKGRLATECPVVFLTLEELSRLMGKDQSTLNVTSNREALTQFCH